MSERGVREKRTRVKIHYYVRHVCVVTVFVSVSRYVFVYAYNECGMY